MVTLSIYYYLFKEFIVHFVFSFVSNLEIVYWISGLSVHRMRAHKFVYFNVRLRYYFFLTNKHLINNSPWLNSITAQHRSLLR